MALRLIFCMLLFFIGATGLMAQKKLKVMSYNIHHGRNGQGEVDLESIADVIENSGADLIGLQEVDSVCNRSGNADQMKVLAGLTGMHYTFRRHFDYDGGSYGLGILSRFPIVNVYDHRISSYPEGGEKSLTLLATDIQVDTARTVHFATVHFDYRKDPGIRLRQSAETIDYLTNVASPVILTGDLNAEPDKTEIKNLFKIFTDTDTSGTFTYPADHPIKKIDYILVSNPHLKKVVQHKVVHEPGASDHRPVTSEIILEK